MSAENEVSTKNICTHPFSAVLKRACHKVGLNMGTNEMG